MALDKTDILNFIRSAPKAVSKREIAGAFHIKGGENRVALKQILKLLEKDGIIIKQPGGDYSVPDGLPNVTVVEILSITVDGEVWAAPTDWNEELQGPKPKIEIQPDKKHFPVLKEQARALVRLKRINDKFYEAHVIKPLDTERGRVLVRIAIQKKGPVLIPTDKRAKYDFDVNPGDLNGAKEGDLAVGEIQPSRSAGKKRVLITEVIGRRDDPKAISLISLHEAGLRDYWPEAVIKDTEGMKVPDVKGREDLRDISLVTIDGADARDFDDAVFAEKTDEGFHLIVAIADVAYYVRNGMALDNEAQRRGNSTYFPDRVVPMLPEALSNDLCSLRPHEPRACMAVHMWIDANGQMKKYKFVRGLMRSEARLTYEQVQAAHDGLTDDTTGPLLEPVIRPLYEAYAVLDKARQERGALDLDLPERKILIDAKGNMTGVVRRERLDAHKLIEEFMILANVAAASALEAKRDADQYPCLYRIHDKPSFDKLESVREFIESFGLSLPKGQVTRPAQINGVLKQGAKLPYSHLISQVILRSQSQAVYSTGNIGHFGLALERYAHFTSPIRRYADLMVHRALISAYDLGPGGLTEEERVRADEIAQHISGTERTSMEAERSAVDRFTAAYLSEQIGAEFSGKISGVTRFGLFVTLDESGADGLIPMRAIGDDFYVHEEAQHALIGRRKGKVFRLGAKVTVRLTEADGVTGSTMLELAGESRNGADIPGMSFKNKKMGRNTGGRDDRPYKKGPRKGPPKGPYNGKSRSQDGFRQENGSGGGKRYGPKKPKR
jgi:ribonuclease R